MLNISLAPDSFGFDIAYWDRLPCSIETHTHDFCEMIYVFSGTGKHVTEQGTYDIGPGDLFVIPPQRGHSYEDRKHMALVNIMFDLNRLPFPADHWGACRLCRTCTAPHIYRTAGEAAPPDCGRRYRPGSG